MKIRSGEPEVFSTSFGFNCINILERNAILGEL